MDLSHDLIAAFAVGFMGSLHCVGMCGGISSALTSAATRPADPGTTVWHNLLYQLLYSLGRISAYAIAGAATGLLGASIYAQMPGAQMPGHGPSWLRIFAGVMMILLALYLSGWWKILNRLEQAGAKVWRHIAPLTRRLFPVDRPHKALLLGFLWGWLPCGLVYSALTWSLGSGGAGRGALLMVGFGLGTLPALLGVGSFSHLVTEFARATGTRLFAALLLAGFGIWTIQSQLGH